MRNPLKSVSGLIGSSILSGFGKTCGVLFYHLLKNLLWLLNLGKPKNSLSEESKSRIKNLLPVKNLEKVKIIEDANLPSLLFLRSIQGITFKNTIYTRFVSPQENYDGMLHLLHELVHIFQIEKLGELSFAARYGHELLKNKGYSDKMPLENEAYSLIRNISANLISYKNTHNLIIKNKEHLKFVSLMEWLEKTDIPYYKAKEAPNNSGASFR